MSNNNFQPDWASPPGDTIKDILDERDLSLKDFSEHINLSIKLTRNLLSGKQSIDADLAENLSSSLGGAPKFWLKREDNYQNNLRRQNDLKIENKQWLDNLPLRDMTKYGWISLPRPLNERVKECLSFFGVDSVEEWFHVYNERLSMTAFRTSKSFDSTPESIVTWLREGELKSKKISCQKWDKQKFRTALFEARKLTNESKPEIFIPQLQQLFSQCGVALVITPTPSKCQASGATFFTKENKAVLLLSFRYLSDDHFWFTLFHEAGHIFLHGHNKLFIEGKGLITEEEEGEANRFSMDLLIPTKFQEELKQLNFKNWRQIPRFAKKVGISSGIIVGQLQYHGLIEKRQLNKFKTRYAWIDEQKKNVV